MTTTINYRFVVRRGVSSAWTSGNPILLEGEFGLELDTLLIKMGDGTTAWNSLGYFYASAPVMSKILDLAFSNTQGSLLYRGASAWAALAPGTTGKFLKTTGASSNPSWSLLPNPSPLTTKGDLWGFDTVDNRIPVGSNGKVLTADSTAPTGVSWQTPSGGGGGGGGSTPLPGVTPNLVYWLRGDLVIGDFLPQLPNSGYLPAVAPVTIGAGATGAASTLNSLPVVNFPGTSAGGYNFAAPNIILHNSTVFIVFNPTLAAAGADFISGGSGAYEWGLSTIGKLELTKALIAVIGDSTTVLSSGVWFQANCTYNDTTGAWAMRIAQAADASGTNIQGITAPLTTFGYNPFSGGVFFLNGLLAELIVYNRVLSPTEITDIEAYLNTKWGV